MEYFKHMRGFEGQYLISNLGQIVSLRRVDATGKIRKQRNLVFTRTKDGYLVCHLWKNKKAIHVGVHRMVYESFVGPIPKGHEINHLNGARDDNRPENLEAVTHADNVRYSKEVLGANYATYGNARLSFEVADQIRRESKQGATIADISAKFGIKKSQICNIRAGRSWVARS